MTDEKKMPLGRERRDETEQSREQLFILYPLKSCFFGESLGYKVIT